MGKLTDADYNTNIDIHKFLESVGAHQNWHNQAISFPNGNSVTMLEMQAAGSQEAVTRLLMDAAYGDIPELPDYFECLRLWKTSVLDSRGVVCNAPAWMALMAPLVPVVTSPTSGIPYILRAWEIHNDNSYALFEPARHA